MKDNHSRKRLKKDNHSRKRSMLGSNLGSILPVILIVGVVGFFVLPLIIPKATAEEEGPGVVPVA